MSEITTIGLDLAKNIFQVHGVDTSGTAVVTKRLRRNQVIGFFADLRPCLVGMEACATAHHWARQLIGLGHEAALLPVLAASLGLDSGHGALQQHEAQPGQLLALFVHELAAMFPEPVAFVDCALGAIQKRIEHRDIMKLRRFGCYHSP